MASTPISLAELKPGRCTRTVVTRLLRFWEARNVQKGGELMGVDLLLLDNQASLIQGSISVHRLNTFRELLREGAMYELSGFDVTRSKHNFKLCDSVVAIRFCESTQLIEVPSVSTPIPTEMFRFRNVEQLMALANTNVELPDIIGEICDIRATYNDHTQTTQRLMVSIRVDKDTILCVSVFDGLAERLNKRLEDGVVHPKVMVATTINPKFIGGRLYLNATSGTHFYFDKEVGASEKLFTELCAKVQTGANSGKPYQGVKKLEHVSLGELNNYVLESPPQAIEFLCKAKISSLDSTNGWCYISCAKCSKKLQRGSSSFTCPTCYNPSAVGVVRYRVEMLVEACEDKSVFVAFDSAMTKLTGVRAAEVANPMGHGEQDPTSFEVPHFLEEIVGQTYVFHLKLNEFNFSASHKSFTVARIFNPNERIPGPTFAPPPGGGNNPDDNMQGAKCDSLKPNIGCPTAGGQPGNGELASNPSADGETTSTNTAVDSTTANAATVELGGAVGNPGKKPRVG